MRNFSDQSGKNAQNARLFVFLSGKQPFMEKSYLIYKNSQFCYNKSAFLVKQSKRMIFVKI